MPREQAADDVVEVTVRRTEADLPATGIKVRTSLYLTPTLLARLDRARAKLVEVQGQPVKRNVLIVSMLDDALSRAGF